MNFLNKRQKMAKIVLSLAIALMATFFVFSAGPIGGTADAEIEYTQVLAADSDIVELSALNDSLQVVEVPSDLVPGGVINELPEGEQLALHNIYEGQMIHENMYKDREDLLSEEMRTFPVPITIDMAGMLSARDKVDVIFYDEYEGSRVILTEVLVEKILTGDGEAVDDSNGEENDSYPAVAELSVSIQDAKTLHMAKITGRLGLAKYYSESQSIHQPVESIEELEDIEETEEMEGE